MSEYLYKITMLGDSGVGKTSLCMRYYNNIFAELFATTIGVEFFPIRVKMDNGDIVKLHTWDTAGQISFQNIIKSYLRDINLFILVFDVSNVTSFNNLYQWISIIKEHGRQDAPVILVANKGDYTNMISDKDIQQFIDMYKDNIIQYIHTSAKNNIHVKELFENVAKYVYENIYMCKSPSYTSIDLDSPKNRYSLWCSKRNDRSGGCC